MILMLKVLLRPTVLMRILCLISVLGQAVSLQSRRTPSVHPKSPRAGQLEIVELNNFKSRTGDDVEPQRASFDFGGLRLRLTMTFVPRSCWCSLILDHLTVGRCKKREEEEAKKAGKRVVLVRLQKSWEEKARLLEEREQKGRV
jgi:hypothetical protein